MEICLAVLVTMITTTVMGCLCARSAYRCGVADGFKRAMNPEDSLYDSNGVNDILREFRFIR